MLLALALAQSAACFTGPSAQIFTAVGGQKLRFVGAQVFIGTGGEVADDEFACCL